MLCEPGGEAVGVHPGEQLLVEAVDVADGLLQDLGLKQSSQWRLDRLNPFGGDDGGVTDPARRPSRGRTVNGNRLYCFTAAAAARIPSNFRSRGRGPSLRPRHVKRANAVSADCSSCCCSSREMSIV